jgi:hypothetical protein
MVHVLSINIRPIISPLDAVMKGEKRPLKLLILRHLVCIYPLPKIPALLLKLLIHTQ